MVRAIERPKRRDPEDELRWLCQCFGFEPGDPRVEILREIVAAEKNEQGVRSTVISTNLQITRGGAVYHLNRMIESGLIVRKGHEYQLRATSLEETLEEVEEDMLRMFKRMRQIAKELDQDLGLGPQE